MTQTAVPAALPAAPSSLSGPAVQPYVVGTPGGQWIHVLGQEEHDYYVRQSARYRTEFAFQNVSDLADLDQLLFLETQAFRFSRWLGIGTDYDGYAVDTVQTRRAMKEVTELIAKVKTGLGMIKTQRDKEQAESVAAYLTNLKQRAREFGVHRETQLTAAIALIQQLFSIVGAYDRADKIEREKLGFPDDNSILDWIREVMRPEFDEIDAHFRANQQKYWVKDL